MCGSASWRYCAARRRHGDGHLDVTSALQGARMTKGLSCEFLVVRGVDGQRLVAGRHPDQRASCGVRRCRHALGRHGHELLLAHRGLTLAGQRHWRAQCNGARLNGKVVQARRGWGNVVMVEVAM